MKGTDCAGLDFWPNNIKVVGSIAEFGCHVLKNRPTVGWPKAQPCSVSISAFVQSSANLDDCLAGENGKVEQVQIFIILRFGKASCNLDLIWVDVQVLGLCTLSL